MTHIAFVWKPNNTPADAYSVMFGDPTSTYGLRRADTHEIVIASGISLTHNGPGSYSYDLTDTQPNLPYEYWVAAVDTLGDLPDYFHVFITGSPAVFPPAPTTAHGLTSLTELSRLYSSIGVDLRSDDDATNGDVINEIIAQATETVASYTLHLYETASLMTSTWTRRIATYLGAYFLSMRRANQPQFVAQAKWAQEQLEKVNSGVLLIPGVAVRAANIPAVSNYKIDDRYFMNKQRVVASRSTSPYPGQKQYEALPGGDDLF
jgi:hypothetical protein